MSISAMKRFFPRIARPLLLAALLALGLSACTEEQTTGNGPDADTTARVEGDLARPGAHDGRKMAPGSVSAESTISLLRQNVQDIPTNRAIQNINAWQQRLQGTEWTTVTSLLESLKMELTASQIDAQAVGELLVKMGARTSTAADSVSGGTARGLDQLAQTLTQTGEQLVADGG